MSQTLFIRLASEALQPMHWWLFSASDHLLASGQVPDAASLASLQQYATDQRVIALVPACDVVLRAVTLPGRLTRKSRHALPFLLEDDVVEDPAQLHVAVLAHQPPRVHLAAVEHGLMQQWLSWLAQAEIRVQQMLPDVLALPLHDEGYRWRLGEQHLIRESRWQGMVLEDELLACLPAAQTSRWQTSHLALPLSVAHLPTATLLQGRYSASGNKTRSLGAWRTPTYLLACCLVLALAVQGLDSFSLSREQSQLEAQMASLYRQTFPGSKRVKDPWHEFNRQIADRSGHFLPLLRALDTALPPSAQVQSLQFDASKPELAVQLSGASPVALAAMEQQLATDFYLRRDEQNNPSAPVTVFLGNKPTHNRERPSALPRIEQIKQQLAQMKLQAAQQTVLAPSESDIAELLASSSQQAHLPAPHLANPGNTLELKYERPLRFDALANWLQTLERQHGIIAQQVELADKGQGNVEVKRLLLARSHRS
jgi:general secretion pathway protein L